MGLKVDLYREIISAVEKQSDAERELSTKLRVLNSLMAVWQMPEQFPGAQLPTPNTSWAELNELFFKCQHQAADLMILIEKWQIVDPRLDIFRMAFGVGLRDLREAWTPLSHLVSAVVAAMPGLPPPQLPRKDALEKVKAASDGVLNAASKVSAWVADFQLEVQGVLLSDLFPNELQHREPLDPELFVVRLDHADKLKDYFENNTPWGMEHKIIQQRTREIIAQRRLG
jgi:hypothetical protein